MKSDWARWLGWLQATALLCAPAVAMPAALSLVASFPTLLHAQAAPAPAPAPPPPAPAPAPAPAPTTAPAPAPPPELTIAQRVLLSLQQDSATLQDLRRTQAEREEAARRLVLARQNPAGDEVIFLALTGNNNPLIIQAIGHAVGDDPTPDPRLINRLTPLLGQFDRATTEAVAMALAAYRDNRALNPLIAYATAPAPGRESQRAAAVRALGAVPDQRVAGELMRVLTTDREQIIQDAAADGLRLMTGIRENGRDPAAWRQWWDLNDPRPPDAKSPLQFKAALADRRPPPGAGMQDLDASVREMYRLAQPAARGDVLVRVLNSPDAPLRAAGVRLIGPETVTAAQVPKGTFPRLPEMIADPSAEVRTEVARTLKDLNRKETYDALLAQLDQEPDPGVRVAIMEALVPLGGGRATAVPVLLRLLNDPSVRVATAAAESLAKTGDAIRPNRPLREEVIATLRATMDGRGKRPGAEDLRAACLEALVPLADRPDPVLGQFFFNLLPAANERERARKAILQGVGVAGEERFARQVLTFLENEPEGRVRLVALQTLGQIGSFANAEAILEFTKPARERDASVREAAWATFVELLPKANANALVQLKDVTFKGQPALRLPVLQELAKRQQEAGNVQELAFTRQNIGDAHLKLGQPREAVPYFRQAMDYFLGQPNVPPQVIEDLVASLMESLLAAKQFPEAAKFAQEAVTRDERSQRTVGPVIVKRAEELVDKDKENKPRDALLLIAEMQKMKPPLNKLWADQLADVEARAKQLTGQPPGP